VAPVHDSTYFVVQSRVRIPLTASRSSNTTLMRLTMIVGPPRLSRVWYYTLLFHNEQLNTAAAILQSTFR